jgi:hypothetical protein
MLKIPFNFHRAAVLLCVLIAFADLAAFGQAETIESLTRKIEANPKDAKNYLMRGELYSDSANEKEFPENLPLVARSVADYSAYLRLKPNDAQVLRMRALARGVLFIEINPFAASDTRRAFRLNPRDSEARDESRAYAAAYPKFYRSKQCRKARIKNGFRDHPTDDPLTALGEALDVQMTADVTVALKYLACGANPNYVYPRSGQPEIFDFIFFRVEHLVALLEAGANPNRTDRRGRTPLMKSLDALVNSGNQIDDEAIEKFRIALDYGANPNARDRSGQSVLSFARKTKNDGLVNLFIRRGAK